MTRILLAALVAAVVAAPACPSEAADRAPSASDELARKLDTWRSRVRADLKSRARREGAEGITRAFEKLARPFVEESSALIDRVYTERLARLPAATPPDPKVYTRRARKVDLGPATVATLYPSAYRLWYPGPASAARYWLDETLRHWEKPEAHELRRALWAVVPPKPGVLPGPGPSVVFDDGDEVFLVKLKRERGLTLPVEVEWWTRE
jgi:hypothetical protein